MKTHKTIWLSLLLLVMFNLSGVTSAPSPSYAQAGCRDFPQTGKQVCGRFLTYWDNNGGLAQQGFPISAEMSEVSETDGKNYTVQYFERAVFEYHPELPAGRDVLLSLLGVFFYNQKYPSGATGQVPNTSTGSVQFPQTGKRLGGTFKQYWETHGALPQQGFPISDEFVETSPTDGKQYKVQYFERAVFEYHPENQPPNDVLLSLLGVFQYNRKYVSQPTPSATPPPGATPTSPPAPGADCSGIPPSQNQTVTPNCGPAGTVFRFSGGGFQPGEPVGIYATEPDGSVFGAPFQVNADGSGTVSGISLTTRPGDPPGIWANTMEGTVSHRKSIGYFKVTSTAPPPPPPTGACDTSGNRNGEARPSSGRPGDTIMFTARGFQPGEAVSYWFTLPNGVVVGTAAPVPGEFVNPDGTIGPLPYTIDEVDVQLGVGRWALTFQGASSGNQAIIYYCVNR